MSKLNWDRALVFEDGSECHLHASLSHTGKLSFARGGSQYSEAFAEWHEQGARRLVRGEDDRFIFAYSDEGTPVRIDAAEVRMDIQMGLKTIIQKDDWTHADEEFQADRAMMESVPAWGMF